MADRKQESERNAKEKYLLKLNASLSDGVNEQRLDESIRVPTKGGDIFVSAVDANSGYGIQADLNAAANIGLRALTDPDWPGRWWYVPCNTSDYKPRRDRVAGCPVIPIDQPLRPWRDMEGAEKPPSSRGGKQGLRSRRGQSEIVNLWRDLSSQDVSSGAEWRPTLAYWRGVEQRVVARLEQIGRAAVDAATPW